MSKIRELPVRYAWLTCGMVAFAHIYGIFGRGVRSADMDSMHLYALLLGFVMFSCLRLIEKASGLDIAELNLYRLFFNIYNSGLAALLSGKALSGIIEIAGGSSAYPPWFEMAGYALMGCGLGILLINLIARLIKGK